MRARTSPKFEVERKLLTIYKIIHCNSQSQVNSGPGCPKNHYTLIADKCCDFFLFSFVALKTVLYFLFCFFQFRFTVK